MFQWTRHTITHAFLSQSPRTDMEDSMELARGVTTTMMTRDPPRLKILASDGSLIVHTCRRVDFLYWTDLRRTCVKMLSF